MSSGLVGPEDPIDQRMNRLLTNWIADLEVGAAFQEARPGELVGAAGDQRQVERLAEDTDVGLADKAVRDEQDPVRVEDALDRFEQVRVPDELVVGVRFDAHRVRLHFLARLFVQRLRFKVGPNLLRRRQVVLQSVRQVVAVAEVKVGRQVNALEQLDVARLVRVVDPHCFVGNVHHRRILNLVDGVIADDCNAPPLGDQHDVVALKKLDKTL